MENNSNRNLLQYAGMATQFLVSIGLAVFLGYKADRWMHISIPVLVWVIPLLVIIFMTYKIIKETSSKK
jgi:chromate transport protein ChrA